MKLSLVSEKKSTLKRERRSKMEEKEFESFIDSKVNGTYKDLTRVYNNELALDYAVNNILLQLKDNFKLITKIVAPYDDYLFASSLAKKLNVEVIRLNPYEGTSDEDLTSDDKVLIVSSALCGGSLYFSMYSLLEDLNIEVLGFAFIVEKVFHRGRFRLLDLVTSSLPIGVISVIKYGSAVGTFVKFDCRHNNLGIRIFRVLSINDEEVGVNWLDGPRPIEKKFPKERIIAISFNRKDWYEYHP